MDCPELELALPARKETVETPFLEEMREAARLCIYRAMAADPDPRPSFADRKRAHEADIDIAAPPAELRPWRPGLADVDDWREPPKRQPVRPDALLMACDPEPPEAQAFWRAAERNGVAGRLFEADRRLEGYAWYDAIARLAAIHIEITADGRTCALEGYATTVGIHRRAEPVPQRPEAIRIGLAVTPHEGPRRILDLDADLAFAGEAWCWAGDALPLVTADSDIEPWQLAQLVRVGFFSASDDADADSWETQWTAFEQDALHAATKLLISDDEARRTSIADAVTRNLFWRDASTARDRPAAPGDGQHRHRRTLRGAGCGICEDPGHGLPVFEGLAARPLRRGPGAAIGHRRLARDPWPGPADAGMRQHRQGIGVLPDAPGHRGRRAPADGLADGLSRYGAVEFEGIVSETLIRTLEKRTGATRLMWRKIAARNEALDLMVYSLALVSHLGLGFVLHEADAIARAAERKDAA